MSEGEPGDGGPYAEPALPERSALRHRPLLSAGVAFCAGIVVARALELGPREPLVAAGLCAAALLALRRLGQGARSVLVLVLIGALGAAHLAAQERIGRSGQSLADLLPPRPTLVHLSGVVHGETSVTKRSPLIETEWAEPRTTTTLALHVRRVTTNGRSVSATGDVQLAVQGELQGVHHGDRVRVLAWVSPLDPKDPFERYAVSSGFVARARAAGPRAVTVEAPGPGSPRRLLYALKDSLRGQIDAHFAGDGASVLKALLLGDRERLGRHVRSVFNQSGTTHVLAISGLHVGIVYGVVFWLCRMLLIERWRRRAIVLTAVFAYAAMVGFRPATVRATLMIFLFELGGALRTYRDPVNAVSAAALVLLVVRPYQLFEAGFQLTFVAVLGILVFASALAAWLRGRPDELERLTAPEFRSPLREAGRRAWRRVAQALAVCAAATLSIAPLQAHYFNIVTPVSVFATALLVPIIGATISLGFLFFALAPIFSPGATVVAAGLRALVAGVIGVAEPASAAPCGHAFVASPPVAWVCLVYAALCLVAARKWLRLSGVRAALAPTAVVCAYLIWRATLGPGPALAATFVDVEHGTCTVVTRGRQTLVYDCGSGTPFSTYDVGRGPAAKQLWKQGIDRIDLLVLSHTDADHVNGVFSLLDRFPVGQVVLNVSFTDDEIGRYVVREFERRGIPFAEAGAGDCVDWEGFRVEVLWPPKGESPWRLNAVNDRSLVARVTADGRSVLLTGDIERAGIGGLLATCDDLRADVLYVPHHGADEPVLPELIAAVAPEVAIVSAARYERDEREKTARLFGGIRLYFTFRDGTITLRSGPGGWSAETER